MTDNFRCIIVDDEPDAIELLSDRIRKLYSNCSISGTFTQWEQALASLRDQNCDLLFLDISMPGKTSIELLKLLPQLEAEIIFVTAYEKYALDAFSFSTSGYILKPVEDTALAAAIDKATVRIRHRRLARQLPLSAVSLGLNDKIGIPNNHGIDYVNMADILYLESTNKCTRVATIKTEYVSSFNLGKFKDFVGTRPFFQVHRTYIINLNYVLRYESAGVVIMSNKKEIPVARAMRNEFLQIFNGGH